MPCSVSANDTKSSHITDIHKYSPSLWASFHPLTPLFSGIRKVRGDFIKSQYEMLKLSTKRWIPAFNAQGSRGIIVAVQVGAVKIYVAAVEVLRKTKKGRHGETHETSKLIVFLSFNPGWMLMYFFAGFFLKNLTPMYDQTQGTGAVFSWLYGYLYCGTMINFWRWQLTFIKGNLTSNALQPYSFPGSSKWSSKVVYFDV